MDDGKLTKALAAARLKDAKREGSDPDEVKALEHLLHLYAEEARAKKKTKDAQAALDITVLKRYGEMSVTAVQTIALNDKWLTEIERRVADEIYSLSVALVDRIRELGDRYRETLSGLEALGSSQSERVARHLSALGVEE